MTTYALGLPKNIIVSLLSFSIFGIVLMLVGSVNNIQLIQSIGSGLFTVGVILILILKNLLSEKPSSVNL